MEGNQAIRGPSAFRVGVVVMSRIGVTDPEMMRRIISATKRSESQSTEADPSRSKYDPDFVNVRNISAFEIPGFGLMQMSVADNVEGRKIVDVTRPFSQTLPSSIFLVNGPFPIPAGDFGYAQEGPIYSVKRAAGSFPVGTRIGWKADSFDATFGCLLNVVGTDDITENIVRAMADFSMLLGTVTTAIPANMAGAGEVLTTNPATTHKAKTKKTGIAVGKEVLIWPCVGEWIAAEVC